MTISERLPVDETNERRIRAHRYRYEWASRFTLATDVVLDAACGTGYGRELLNGTWIGVDAHPSAGVLVADLRTWRPDFDFDVFVGLETIEHLDHIANYLAIARAARRTIVISTPIVPTSHFNPFHVRDFTRESLTRLFEVGGWHLVAYEEQLATYGLFAFVRR